MPETKTSCTSVLFLKRNTKYHVFASYCFRDKEKVKHMLFLLQQLGLTINDPDVDFVPGEPVFRCILEKGMDISKMTILFITKNFLSSEWCRYEAYQAIWKYVTSRGKHRVIPLLLENCKVPNYLKVINCIHLWKYQVKNGIFASDGKTYSKRFIIRLHKALTAPALKYRPIRWIGIQTFNRGKNIVQKMRQSLKRDKEIREEKVSSMNPFKRLRLGTIISHSILNCKYGTCNFSCSGKNFILFERHLVSCKFFPLSCPHKKCGYVCPRWDMANHSKVCKFAVLKCELGGCKFSGTIEALHGHRSHCQYREVSCVNRKRGCMEKVMFKDYTKHIDSCRYGDMTCQNCKETFSKHTKDKHVCPNSEIECHECKRHIKIEELQHHLNVCKDTFEYCDMCNRQFTKIKMVQHVTDCPFRIVTCKYKQCRYQDHPNKIERHMFTCEYQPKQCDNCGRYVPSKQLRNHIRECREMIKCENCGVILQRSSQHTHDRYICSRKTFQAHCEYCNQIIPYNALSEHKRIHMEELKNDVETPRRERSQTIAAARGSYKRGRTTSVPSEYPLEAMVCVIADNTLPDYKPNEEETDSRKPCKQNGKRESLEIFRKLLVCIDKNSPNLKNLIELKRSKSVQNNWFLDSI